MSVIMAGGGGRRTLAHPPTPRMTGSSGAEITWLKQALRFWETRSMILYGRGLKRGSNWEPPANVGNGRARQDSRDLRLERQGRVTEIVCFQDDPMIRDLSALPFLYSIGQIEQAPVHSSFLLGPLAELKTTESNLQNDDPPQVCSPLLLPHFPPTILSVSGLSSKTRRLRSAGPEETT